MAEPLFKVGKTFNSKVDIEGVELPIHVRRLDRAGIDAIEKAWKEIMMQPRGSARTTCETCTATLDQKDLFALELERIAKWDASVHEERLAFFEQTIRDNITVDAGLIEVDGESVTTGAGVLEFFYSRKDVLRSFVLVVYAENHLSAVLAKNSKSPQGSDTGSEVSIPTRGGASQGSTVGNAESSEHAPSAGATDGNSSETDAPASRGASVVEIGRKVH